MKILMRQEIESDFSEVYELNKAAFEQDVEANLVSLLRKSEAFIPELSLVACLNDKIVGHILFTRIKIVDQAGNEHASVALAPMAVLPEFQKKGIGSELVREGLQKATESGHHSVIVLGHEKYYPKFGFVPAERWNIKSPFEVPSENFMGLELVKDGLADISGTLQYAKEFEMV